MKTALIYYSLDGNCRLVAEMLKEELGADLFSIETVDSKKRTGLSKFVWGGRMVFTRKEPPLKPLAADLAAYDLLILGAPVWAGSPAPPMMSFLTQTAFPAQKRFALFCCHMGGMGKALETFKSRLAEHEIVSAKDFISPEKQEAENVRASVKEWALALKTRNCAEIT
ncbi:MAG: NAD(P)H-dependent oxidoreductase [Treponema sp.]|jgi:flavodoxin|nr:NAD(P)H-dependent oxidoreductase [Treponema sp.]